MRIASTPCCSAIWCNWSGAWAGRVRGLKATWPEQTFLVHPGIQLIRTCLGDPAMGDNAVFTIFCMAFLIVPGVALMAAGVLVTGPIGAIIGAFIRTDAWEQVTVPGSQVPPRRGCCRCSRLSTRGSRWDFGLPFGEGVYPPPRRCPRTSRCSSPRGTMLRRQVGDRAPNPIRSKRSSSTSSAILPSRRASGAPRQ